MAKLKWQALARRDAVHRQVEPLGNVENTDKLRAATKGKAERGLPRFVVREEHVRIVGGVPTAGTMRMRTTKTYGAHRGHDGARQTERQADAMVLALAIAHSDGAITTSDYESLIVTGVWEGRTAQFAWFATLRMPWFDTLQLTHGMRRAMRHNRYVTGSAQ